MNSKTTRHFWAGLDKLPEDIRRLAREKFALWQSDPFHPSLQFKELAPGVWSVRITQKYRALGQENGDRIVWYWIGTHDDYDARV